MIAGFAQNVAGDRDFKLLAEMKKAGLEFDLGFTQNQ